MNKNCIKINDSIMVFTKKFVGKDGICAVYLELYGKGGRHGEAVLPKVKIKDKNFKKFLLNVLNQFDFDFTLEEEDQIKMQIEHSLSEEAVREDGERFDELLSNLYIAAGNNAVIPESDLCIDSKLGYLLIKADATVFQKVINDHGGNGIKALEFKKWLKKHELIDTNGGRDYDRKIYQVGNKAISSGYRYVAIPLTKMHDLLNKIKEVA